MPRFDQADRRLPGQAIRKKEVPKQKAKKLHKRAKSVTHKSKETFPQVRLVSMNLEMFDVGPSQY